MAGFSEEADSTRGVTLWRERYIKTAVAPVYDRRLFVGVTLRRERYIKTGKGREEIRLRPVPFQLNKPIHYTSIFQSMKGCGWPAPALRSGNGPGYGGLPTVGRLSLK